MRRSLRRDDFYTTSEDEDEVDEDYDYDDGDNSIEENDASANNSQSASSSQIESKKGTKSDPSETSAREDEISGWTKVASATNASASPNDEDQLSMSSLGESESRTNPASENTSRRSSKRFSTGQKSYRETQFEKVLGVPSDGDDDKSRSNHVVKMSELRKIAWNGIPPQYRGTCWKILLGYLPTNAMRRQQTLERKRAEYKDAIQQHYYIDDNSRTIQEQETLRQVLVDVPRTAPEVPLFRNEKIKRALSRLLYIWAMRHPASSYVQGINDLATPLFAVFLADDYEGEDVLDGKVMMVLEEDRLDEVRTKTDSIASCMFLVAFFLTISIFKFTGGGRRLLVFDQHFGRDPGSLHSGSTRSPTNGNATPRTRK